MLSSSVKATKIVPKDNLEMINSSTPIKIKIKENKFGECGKLLATIISVSGMIVWEIFAIISLVNNPNSAIQEMCPDSNIWTALLLITIITGINFLFCVKKIKNKNKNKNKNKKADNLAACFGLGIFIWLCIELFNTCATDNLRKNDVYRLSNAYFWIFIGIILLTTFIILLLFCLSCCCKKRKVKQPDASDFV